MATIVVGSGNYIRPYRPGARIVAFAPALSQDYEVGDFVVESTDTASKGKVLESGADPAAVVGVAAAASDTTDAKDSVYVADPETEFMGHVENAATPDGATIGLECGIVKDTTNDIWRVDLSDTTNKVVKVTQVLDPGDVNGRVVFKILAAARAIFA
jgi:hypothetical protein